MVSSRPPKSFGLNKCLIGYSLYFVLALVNYIMTPKEKANELGNKFYQGSVFDYDKQGHLKEIERAKERTKICVQAILDAVTTIADKKFDFYTEVMKEIDNL